VRSDSTVTYEVYSYDPDGDEISYEWDWSGDISSVAAYSDDHDLTVNGDGDIVVTATDSPQEDGEEAQSSSATIDVDAVDGIPPQLLYASLDPNVVTLEDGANAQAVNLIFAADHDLDGLSYSWSIAGEQSLGEEDVPFDRGEEMELEEVVPQGSLGSGNYRLTLTITGQKAEEQVRRTLNLLVTEGNLEVIVQ
jgi:hypothetical protein